MNKADMQALAATLSPHLQEIQKRLSITTIEDCCVLYCGLLGRCMETMNTMQLSHVLEVMQVIKSPVAAALDAELRRRSPEA